MLAAVDFPQLGHGYERPHAHLTEEGAQESGSLNTAHHKKTNEVKQRLLSVPVSWQP